MKKLKLILTAIICSMVICMVVPKVNVNAAGLTLSQLRAKFPAGKYWNHIGSSTNNPDGWTNTPCTHHFDANGNSKCYLSGSCGCNNVGKGWNAIQCMGFAYQLGYDAFGSNPGKSWTTVTGTAAKNYVNNGIKPGDVVRFLNDTHSMFVTKVSGNTITYAECNVGGNCIIRWDRTITRANLNTTLTNVKKAPGTLVDGPSKPMLYAEVGTSSTKTTFKWGACTNTHHYDLRIYNRTTGAQVGNTINNITTTSYAMQLDAGDYYATLTSVASDGSYAVSDHYEFTVLHRAAKAIVNVASGTEKVSTVFTWTKATHAVQYKLVIFKLVEGNYYLVKESDKISGLSYSTQLDVGEYRANLITYASNGAMTEGDYTKFKVIKTPTISSDGWYYTDILPSNINSKDYIIEYRSYSEVIQETSPGSNWVNKGLVKSEYVNTGNPYESLKELPVSNTRVLVKAYYYHFCGGSAGNAANYTQDSKYVHYDAIHDLNSVTVSKSGPDSTNPNATYYYLKWKSNGAWAYCSSGVTCDGSAGSHGNRTYVWYKNSKYQDRRLANYYKFVYNTGWTSTADTSAQQVTYRYKPKASTDSFPFTDVSKSKWYYSTIKEVHKAGLMTGTSETKFSPDDNMTRGMIVTVLHRIAGKPAATYKGTFKDVPKATYCATAVEWAAKNKIVSGYANGKFGPSDNITRQDVAVMLYNYAKSQGVDVKGTNLNKFADRYSVSSYAKEAMQWAVSVGILSGAQKDGSIYLNPRSNATRAECAKMLLVASKLFK